MDDFMLIVIFVSLIDYAPFNGPVMIPAMNEYCQQANCKKGGAVGSLEDISEMPMKALQLRGAPTAMQHLSTTWLSSEVIVIGAGLIRKTASPNVFQELMVHLPTFL